MQIFSHPWLIAFFSFLLLAHFLSALFASYIERIIKYANIALHIILYFFLMLAKIPLQEAALLYLVSLLFYLCAFLLFESLRKKRACESGNKEKGGVE